MSGPLAGRDNLSMPHLDTLGDVRIASPCPERWSKMKGTDSARFCQKCQLTVYDFTRMTTAEVRALLDASSGARVCARFYRRQDGRVMTRDCPRAVRQLDIERWALSLGGFVAAFVLLMAALVTLFGDNIRRQFGMSAGGLAGEPMPPPAVEASKHKTMHTFGENHSY